MYVASGGKQVINKQANKLSLCYQTHLVGPLVLSLQKTDKFAKFDLDFQNSLVWLIYLLQYFSMEHNSKQFNLLPGLLNLHFRMSILFYHLSIKSVSI